MVRSVGMRAVPGRQQKEREHLLRLMRRQDQLPAPLPLSSCPAETGEHVPAPSSGGMEHDALLKPACANGVCRHFPSMAAAILPKPLIAAPSMGQRAPHPQPLAWRLLGLQTAGALAMGFTLLLHGRAPPAPGTAWEGHLSTQPLLMAGLSFCWGRAQGIPWRGHVHRAGAMGPVESAKGLCLKLSRK